MEKIIEKLKSSGYKLTQNRKDVLSYLIMVKKPVSLKDIQNNYTKINFASIYRIINLFLDLNIVRKVNFGERYQRYEIEVENEHHHHVVCSVCGMITILDYCFVKQIEKETNFKIQEHTMEFIGLCPKCAKKLA